MRVRRWIKKQVRRLGYEIIRVGGQQYAQGQAIRGALEHNTRERVDEFYSDARRVALYLDEDREHLFDDVIERIRALPQPSTVIDVGCGTGDLLGRVSQIWPSSTLLGLEFSDVARDVACRRFPGISFEAHDLYEDWGGAGADLVLCTEVLEHLLYPARALRNLLQMVRMSGTLVITVPNGRFDTFAGHINFWSPESWRVFLEGEAATMQFPCDVKTAMVQDGRVNLGLVRRPSASDAATVGEAQVWPCGGRES